MPHLKGESESLDALIAELKGLDAQQSALKGRLQEITRLRQEAERRGQSLRSRIAAQLQGKLGFTNENLLAFRDQPAQAGPTPPGAPGALQVNREQGRCAGHGGAHHDHHHRYDNDDDHHHHGRLRLPA